MAKGQGLTASCWRWSLYGESLHAISILCANRLSAQMPSFAKLSIIFAHLQSKVLKNVGDNYRENTNNRLAHVEGGL